MDQKALVVLAQPGDARGVDELNVQLNRGWRVAKVAPMGGAAAGSPGTDGDICFAALVILERRRSGEAELAAEVEEAEEMIEGIVEGNGDPDAV